MLLKLIYTKLHVDCRRCRFWRFSPHLQLIGPRKSGGGGQETCMIFRDCTLKEHRPNLSFKKLTAQ